MILVKANKGGVELSDKKSVVLLNNETISLNDEKISASGEYEASGIEVVYGEASALVVWERLQVVYVFKNQLPTGFEKSQFSSCDVLIFSCNAGENALTKEVVNASIESFDPKSIIFSSKEINDGLLTTLKATASANVKLTEQSLPEEGREVYVLE